MSRKNHKDKAKDNEKIKAEEQKLEAAEAAGQAEVVEQTEEGPNEAEVYETSEDILLEAGRDESLKPRRSIPDTVRMGGSLLIICAVVALVVSFVNAITVDIIAEAEARQKREAIGRIFGERAAIAEFDALEGTNALYAIADGVEGYCVDLDAKGFGGKINMMVGVGADGTLMGVEIVSLSETPGLGARVNNAEYLRQYVGKGSGLTIGKEISAISGATISSKAVLTGVNTAVAALVEAGLVPEIVTQDEPDDEMNLEDEWIEFDWEDDMDGGGGE